MLIFQYKNLSKNEKKISISFTFRENKRDLCAKRIKL